MESFLIVIFIMFVTFAMRKGRFDALDKGRNGRRTVSSGEPAFKPDRRLTREIDDRRTKERRTAAPGTAGQLENMQDDNGNGQAGQTSFAESYREDPAQTAGMKGRRSTVPASGRSSILEADDELNEMLAARRNRIQKADSAEGGSPDEEMTLLDMMFAGRAKKRSIGNLSGQAAWKHRAEKGASSGGLSGIFAGFEDRGNDWLAKQIQEEEHAKRRIMSDMLSLKVEHEQKHDGIHKNVIGRGKRRQI